MNLRDTAMVLTVCLVWAFNFIAAAKGVEYFSPQALMVLRFAMVLVVTFPFLRRPTRGHWWPLLGGALCIGALHFTLMFWALQRSTDVTSIVIIQQMYIPIGVMLAIAFLGERAGWKTLASIALATAGIVVIGFDPLVFGQLDVLALSLISAFFQALGSVFMRRVHGIGMLGFQAWSAVFVLPILGLLWGLSDPDPLATVAGAQPIHWAAVAYSALFASLVGHGLFFILIQRNPLPDLMPYLLLTPVFGAAFGVLVWGDQPGWRLLSGGVMVLAGIFFVTLRSRARQRLASEIAITE